MIREKATQIVSECLKEMNPDMWNGNGNRPTSFDISLNAISPSLVIISRIEWLWSNIHCN